MFSTAASVLERVVITTVAPNDARMRAVSHPMDLGLAPVTIAVLPLRSAASA